MGGRFGLHWLTSGFAGGIVFYNAFLPIIATEDQYDRVSAKGFSYGYLGSVILLVVNLIVISNYKFFGFKEDLLAVPTAFVMVGLWWIGFSQIPLKRLPEDRAQQGKVNLFTKGYEEIRRVWRVVRRDRNTLAFLTAFFFYNEGRMPCCFWPLFLPKSVALHHKRTHFAGPDPANRGWRRRLAVHQVLDRKGNKFSLMIQAVIWTAICATGYWITSGLEF